MGQKVSPVGLRIGVNKDWESKWYANNKDFSKYLMNDVKIRKFLEKKFKAAGVAQIAIERNAKKSEVIMYVQKPGLVDFNELRSLCKERVGNLIKTEVDREPMILPVIISV